MALPRLLLADSLWLCRSGKADLSSCGIAQEGSSLLAAEGSTVHIKSRGGCCAWVPGKMSWHMNPIQLHCNLTPSTSSLQRAEHEAVKAGKSADLLDPYLVALSLPALSKHLPGNASSQDTACLAKSMLSWSVP
jgi:hypothetical protein